MEDRAGHMLRNDTEPRWTPDGGRHGPSGYTSPTTYPSSAGSE